MRLFVCVEPPQDAVEHLDEYLAVRRGSGPEVRWSHPDQWHLTLAFMGSAPERVVEDVVDAVAAVAARTPRLELSVAGRRLLPRRDPGEGALGGRRRVGGGAGRPVAAGRGVRSACSVAGAAPAGGPFVPHLTLGRFPAGPGRHPVGAGPGGVCRPAVDGVGGRRRRVAPAARTGPPPTARGARAARPRRVRPRTYTGGGIRPGCRGPRSSAG